MNLLSVSPILFHLSILETERTLQFRVATETLNGFEKVTTRSFVVYICIYIYCLSRVILVKNPLVTFPNEIIKIDNKQ